MPQERNLREYLKPLSAHSVLIALIVIAAALISLLVTIPALSTQPYEGQALLILQNDQQLVLTRDPQFQETVGDPNRQQKAKVLASSLDIAAKVQQRAATETNAEIKALAAKDPLELEGAITVDSRGDLLYINAQAPSVPVATWLANAWAQEAAAKINAVSATSSTNVGEAVNQAQAQLATDEQALQQFMASNQINTLSQEITQTQKFLDVATLSNMTNQFTLFSAERQAAQEKLNAYYSYVYSLDQDLNEMRALRTRAAQGPDAPDTLYANQVTLLVLLNKIITANPGPAPSSDHPVAAAPSAAMQLQFNTSDLSKAPISQTDQLRDFDTTIATVQKLQEDLRGQIQALESRLSAPLPTAAPSGVGVVPAAIQEQIVRQNQLESQLEQKLFELSQLQKTRDLQQSTYDLLRSRLAEQQVNQVISSMIAVATPASDDATLHSRSPWRTILVSGGLALLIAIVVGIALAYLLSLLRPNFNSNVALKRMIRRRAESPV